MAHYNLGLALARQGRLAEARQQFAEVLRLDPNHTGARRLLSAIEP
jgi:Flp pilus assembly protein TadD